MTPTTACPEMITRGDRLRCHVSNKPRWTVCLLLAGGILAAASSAAPDSPRWSDPGIFDVNREPAHAFSLVFPDVDSARPEPNWANPFAASSRYRDLNGIWKFLWRENPAQRPDGFFEKDFDASGWDNITAPLPWQVAGYGQLYYLNINLPMLLDPRNAVDGAKIAADAGAMNLMGADTPFRQRQVEAALKCFVPTVWNPTGYYVREFDIPPEWVGKRIVLHFSGVKSAFTCWVNGRDVGYSQDSFTPAEFNVTDFVKNGSNRLAMEVVRWSDGTYMENQDRIRMSGIFRDVYLFATPKTHIGDFYVRAELPPQLDQAALDVRIDVRNTSVQTAADRSVAFELMNDEGKTVFRADAGALRVAAGETVSVTLTGRVEHPKLWHPEQPNLYTGLIILKEEGNVVEVIRQDVAFRRFEWDELGNVYLNGKRYYFRGVNRSDCSPITGYYVDYQDMLDDARLMRRLNIDSVRTSHNPNDPRWYALCNRFGITVIDEANLESHTHENIYTHPDTEPLWTPQAVFRMRNMVERDKNQPCIVMWSIGNEQFDRKPGLPTVRAMYDITKSIDPSRPVFCERMFDPKGDASHDRFFEFIGPMYRGHQTYATWHASGKDRRPFFMSEYAHAMGNSMPDLDDTWAFFEQHEGQNGGHIWDWRDQSVLYPLPGLEGKHFTYGGDWNEPTPSDTVFCMNGVVLPDHGLNGKSHQVKAVYQQVAFTAGEEPGTLRVVNKFALRNLRDLDISWSLLKDGVVIERGALDIDLLPHAEKEIAAPVDVSELDPAADYHLNLDTRLKEPMPWADAGYVVAQSQVQIQQGAGDHPAPPEMDGEVEIREDEDGWMIVRAGAAEYRFDTTHAVLSQIVFEGRELLAPDVVVPGLEVNFNQHPTDDYNVRTAPHVRKAMDRDLHALTREPGTVKISHADRNRVVVEIMNRFLNQAGEGYGTTSRYTIRPGGVADVATRVRKIGLTGDDVCFRIGIRIPVRKEFGQSSYLGYGPHENYVSRRDCTRYGVYTHGAADFFEHYVRPQECGNRSGLTWIALHDVRGIGLKVVGGHDGGNGSVMPWPVETFRHAAHIPEFPESDRWVLRYDAAHAGIARWPDVIFPDETYEFNYSIQPMN